MMAVMAETFQSPLAAVAVALGHQVLAEARPGS